VEVESMGEILAFKQPAPPRRRSSTNGEMAEILFFTGVRYVPVREHADLLKRARRRPRRTAAERLAKENVT
jgi:hypothetical protein